MPAAELIAIGTELLLGEIQDTNTRFLTRAFRDLGIDVYRSTLIGDNPDRIANLITEALRRSDILMTTGGLGPTIDDPTREAVSRAMQAPLEFHEDQWEIILKRFTKMGRTPTNNNKKQALFPRNAKVIKNDVGTAPAFFFETQGKIIICVPGVPREMEYIFTQEIIPLLNQKYDLNSTILARVLHTSGIAESQIDEWIAEYELSENPTVGLLAHSAQVDIRITAKAKNKTAAENMIQPIADLIIQKVKTGFYGMDDVTMEDVVTSKLNALNKKMYAGLYGNADNQLLQRFRQAGTPLSEYHITETPIQNEVKARKTANDLQNQYGDSVIFLADIQSFDFTHHLQLALLNDNVWKYELRSFADSTNTNSLWISNSILDFLRRNL